MSKMANNPTYTVTIHVFGRIMARDFPIWILCHAKKLGLENITTHYLPDCLQVSAVGSEEMLDALALGCSLGPATVMVERIACTYSEVA
jgi:hypothetical protein